MEFHIVVEGSEGAIDFHFITCSNPEIVARVCNGSALMSMGVEMHKASSPEKANHPTCWLLGGRPCYHDGTSLWASETVMPAFLRGGSDAVYPLLESCYRDRFLAVSE